MVWVAGDWSQEGAEASATSRETRVMLAPLGTEMLAGAEPVSSVQFAVYSWGVKKTLPALVWLNSVRVRRVRALAEDWPDTSCSLSASAWLAVALKSATTWVPVELVTLM